MSLPDLAGNKESLYKLQKLYRALDINNAFVIKNILLVGSAPQSKVVTFINPNLYRVAVEYYGDANLWTVIAQANGLRDPKYTGTISLLIPPAGNVSTGGLLK